MKTKQIANAPRRLMQHARNGLLGRTAMAKSAMQAVTLHPMTTPEQLELATDIGLLLTELYVSLETHKLDPATKEIIPAKKEPKT